MIELKDGYFITADTYNYTLKQHIKVTKKKDGSVEDGEKIIGYYGSVKAAIIGCINDIQRKTVSSETVVSLNDSIKAINGIYDDFIKLLDIRED